MKSLLQMRNTLNKYMLDVFCKFADLKTCLESGEMPAI
jgi:hypothetical protein